MEPRSGYLILLQDRKIRYSWMPPVSFRVCSQFSTVFQPTEFTCPIDFTLFYDLRQASKKNSDHILCKPFSGLTGLLLLQAIQYDVMPSSSMWEVLIEISSLAHNLSNIFHGRIVWTVVKEEILTNSMTGSPFNLDQINPFPENLYRIRFLFYLVNKR